MPIAHSSEVLFPKFVRGGPNTVRAFGLRGVAISQASRFKGASISGGTCSIRDSISLQTGWSPAECCCAASISTMFITFNVKSRSSLRSAGASRHALWRANSLRFFNRLGPRRVTTNLGRLSRRQARLYLSACALTQSNGALGPARVGPIRVLASHPGPVGGSAAPDR